MSFWEQTWQSWFTLHSDTRSCTKNCVLKAKRESSIKLKKVSNCFINTGQFYRCLRKSIVKRLMREADLALPNFIKVMYCENWSQDVQSDLIRW